MIEKLEQMEEPVALIFEDKIKLVKGFTEFFKKLVDQKGGKFNVALSGGSTPKIWFEHLSKSHKEDLPWKRVHFYWGDERCVPPDDSDSNYGMTKTFLLDHIGIPENNIHRVLGELPPTEAASSYIQELSNNFNGEDIPIFDLIILGMGDDGHTASIFPHEIDLWNSDELCVVATHPTSGQHRVSFSGEVFNNAKSVAFLVTGENKAERVKEIIDEEPHASYYPASLVKPINGTLHWFLDAEAAKLINDNE